MKKNVGCASACTTTNPMEVTASAARRLMDRIKEDYHAHLLVFSSIEMLLRGIYCTNAPGFQDLSLGQF